MIVFLVEPDPLRKGLETGRSLFIYGIFVALANGVRHMVPAVLC